MRLIVLLALFGCAAAPHSIDPPKTEPRPGLIGAVGDTANHVSTPTQIVVLGGGGPDVDAAMRLFAQAANRGDVAVLRTSGGTAYNPYLFELAPVHSVETYRVASRELALNPRLGQVLRDMEAVFLAGGDQATYFEHWENTQVSQTLAFLMHEKRGAIGGTSAGAMFLGGFVFDAREGTVTSEEALLNPMSSLVSVRQAAFPPPTFLERWLVDTHFTERNRMGRLITFLARTYENGVCGLGLDEETAVVIDAAGQTHVLGQGSAWIVCPPQDAPPELRAGSPLEWDLPGRPLRVVQVPAGRSFSMARESVDALPATHHASVRQGVLHLAPVTP